MNATLEAWNQAGARAALDAMLACCGSRRWATAMIGLRPIGSIAELSEAADRVWNAMEESDWLEAFACHPRIGEDHSVHGNAQSATWSREEQSATGGAQKVVLQELAAGNLAYERQFGFTYIVCAMGKSAEEMLEILTRRLSAGKAEELREAGEQQRQIMQIRLGRWLAE
jgi:OHCU decarboxylase